LPLSRKKKEKGVREDVVGGLLNLPFPLFFATGKEYGRVGEINFYGMYTTRRRIIVLSGDVIN
jgi:hypothetical protein